MKKLRFICFFSFIFSVNVIAQDFISEKKEPGAFTIACSTGVATICTDENDYWLVQKSASLLQQDIEMATGKRPAIIHSIPVNTQNIIIIGSIGQSAIIKKLAENNKLNTSVLKGKWEAYQLVSVSNPVKGTSNALVIAGSDKRGTAYGIFELSAALGVSPWYWWADVPVKLKQELYVKRGTNKTDAPAVKYRGIFINDEAPAFSGWTKEKFGGVNHNVYEKIFELLLRMKANYLWPAMWGNAFNDDDTLNPVLADKYGIVMGTSHHEPMLRAQQEWKRYGKGDWNYSTNDTLLKEFWRTGIKNMGTHESIVTVGMRGDGDKPMTEGTAIDLLEKIVKDQRKIITEVTGKQPSATPQMWALYKEVQDYYDKGMRVPDDITLLLCDDNWGNLRKLPKLTDKPRSGGYGIYYHFDYVGGPRNYKWINTNQIERTWEQMHLAYEYGVDRVWVVNVGDLKPMEFPINFFLDYAWKPRAWPAEKLPAYYIQWAGKQFGREHAKAIADILAKYTKYNSRRKPELLSPDTYSVANYDEAGVIIKEWDDLLADAQKAGKLLSPKYKDAFYELILHPVLASANLNKLYITVAKNRAYAKQGLAEANVMADSARKLYLNDSLISKYYNDTLAGGKWKHMMDQTHIGYTYWQQPPENKMPDVTYVSSTLKTSTAEPAGAVKSSIEGAGYIAIEAENYTRAVGTTKVKWTIIPNLGRTLSGVEALPITAPKQSLSKNSPHLEYTIHIPDTGFAKLHASFSPTLNFHGEGLQYAISIDNEIPQIVNIHEGYTEGVWNKWVADNIIEKVSLHKISKPGPHLLKFWMIDPAVVLQRLVIDLGKLQPSYLGPKENNNK